MAIYLCKIRVGQIIYMANIAKDLIDDVIRNEDQLSVLPSLEQGNIDKSFSYKIHSKKVEVISYQPIDMDVAMDTEDDVRSNNCNMLYCSISLFKIYELNQSEFPIIPVFVK